MKHVSFILVLLFTASLHPQQIYYTFSKLQGMEDQQGNTPKRNYQYNLLDSYNHSLVKGVGSYLIQHGYDFGVTDIILKGAVINGILYGDTTVTSVEDEITPPEKFSLSQNYPNPFNPITKIKFTIPASSIRRGGSSEGGAFVQHIVYDVLGNKVAALVNEEKLAGSYEVEFDGSGLASGIYL